MNNICFKDFSNLVNNINIKVLEHGYFTGDSRWNFKNVSSPFNRLYFVTGGSGSVSSKENSIKLKEGFAYIVPLSSTCSYYCPAYLEKFYIHFRLELFSGWDVFESAPGLLALSFERKAFESFLRRIGSSSAADILFCKAYLIEILSEFMSKFNDVLADRICSLAKYTDVLSFISENLKAGLLSEEISDMTHIPLKKLSRNFRSDTGYTLKRYIDMRIVQAAKEKLILTRMSIKDIAYQLDFSDEFYFSRFFKKHTGVCPKEFRKSNSMIFDNKFSGPDENSR